MLSCTLKNSSNEHLMQLIQPCYMCFLEPQSGKFKVDDCQFEEGICMFRGGGDAGLCLPTASPHDCKAL
jgi:hypothetical protein